MNCQIVRGVSPIHKEQIRLEVQQDRSGGGRVLCITSFPGTTTEYVPFRDIRAVLITTADKDNYSRFDNGGGKVVVVLRRRDLSVDVVLLGDLYSSVVEDWYAQQDDSSNWIILDYASSTQEGSALDTRGTLGRHVVWKIESSAGWHKQRATLPPYPHTRHDMLGLCQNESVMKRLTRGGDSRIELSADGVSISGVLSGTSQPCENDTDSLDTFRSTCTFDCVIIVGNKTIYATSQNGSVLGKISLHEYTSTVLKDSRGSVLVFRSNNQSMCACLSSNSVPLIIEAASRNMSSSAPFASPSPRNVTPRYGGAPSKSPSVSSTSVSERGSLSYDQAVKNDKLLPSLLDSYARDTCAVLSLSSRVEELERELLERDALIRLLQERLMASTIESTRNIQYQSNLSISTKSMKKTAPSDKARAVATILTRQDEMEFLQQHLDCLRQYCRSLEQKVCEHDEGPVTNWETLSDQEALRQALLESNQREKAAKRRIENLTKDLNAVKKATDEALRIMATKVEKAVEDVFELKINVEPVLSIDKIKCLLKSVEDRADEQTKINTHALKQQVSFLTKELRARDLLLDEAFKDEGGGAISAITSTVTRLHKEQKELQIQVGHLQRHVEDIEETNECVTVALDKALSAQRSPLQTELVKILEQKVTSLTHLQHVQQFIARTSMLQRTLEKYEFSAVSNERSKWAVGTVTMLD